MANTLGRVLIVGKDLGIMESRRAILDHFWPIDLRTVDTWEQENLTDHLVVLCSSIPDSEQQEWIDLVRHRSPLILVVRVDGFDCGPHGGADATVDELNGPGALVSTIYELLTERGLGSRAWPIPGEPPLLQ